MYIYTSLYLSPRLHVCGMMSLKSRDYGETRLTFQTYHLSRAKTGKTHFADREHSDKKRKKTITSLWDMYLKLPKSVWSMRSVHWGCFSYIYISLHPEESGGRWLFVFPLHLNWCIIYEAKHPENLVEMFVGCVDMKTGESFANYFPVCGWMLFITPALTLESRHMAYITRQ